MPFVIGAGLYPSRLGADPFRTSVSTLTPAGVKCRMLVEVGVGTMSPSMDTPLLGFSHVQLRVDDVAASRDWYTTVLGVEPLTASDDLSYVALQHQPSHLVIVLSPRIGDAAGVPSERLDHLAFAVRDGEVLQEWADHLTEAGIDHRGIVLELGKPSLQLRDPDGISIEIVAPAPRRS